LLLLLVYRPEYLHAWASKAYHAQIALVRLPEASSAEMVRAILSKPYASKLPVERLTPEQSTELVQELLGTRQIPAELEQFVAVKTDGNPFFAEELTLALGFLLRALRQARRKGCAWPSLRDPEPSNKCWVALAMAVS
jgi:hypothetical protein